jgi:O-succinylbenzoic acid--CoA ligase
MTGGKLPAVPRLVAIDARGDEGFVDALRAAWDRGDAVLPVDPRLPAPARERLLAAVGAGLPSRDGDAVVVATSGTTGDPKGVVLTHEAVRASALATSRCIGVDPGHDHWLACLPLAHVGGLSVVMRALLTGTRLTVQPQFEPAAAVASGATLVSLVATALRRIDPAAFRVIVLGGSAPPSALPPNVVTTYGMTETGSGVVYDGVPLDGVEVDVADGQIRLRAPMLLRCYRTVVDGEVVERDPRDGDGWFATGDGGGIGPDGRLRVSGRLADVVVTGGEKVWPTPVEEAIRGLASVADVAVAGRPDPEWGERVVAFVVPAPGEVPTLDGVRAAVREVLPAYCAPKELVLVDDLPRTALGKVRRHQL